MNWLHDLFYFLTVPLLVIFFGVLTFRGHTPKRFKIVRETNSLGEERFEVWFEYSVFPLVNEKWHLEEKFDTEQQANDFIARKSTQKQIIKQGDL